MQAQTGLVTATIESRQAQKLPNVQKDNASHYSNGRQGHAATFEQPT